jgi:hypothetical protein
MQNSHAGYLLLLLLLLLLWGLLQQDFFFTLLLCSSCVQGDISGAADMLVNRSDPKQMAEASYTMQALTGIAQHRQW